MSKRIIQTPDAPPPGGPYSQAVVAGDWLYCAGTTPHRTDRSLNAGPFEDQARTTFDNLAAVVRAAGASLSQVVRIGVYLRSNEHFDKMNEIFTEYFPKNPPARTTLQIELPGFDIEIDAVVYTANADST